MRRLRPWKGSEELVSEESPHDGVLVVSAHEGRRLSLRRLLTHQGYAVHVAGSAREAIYMLADAGRYPWSEPDPTLILADQENLGDEVLQVISAVRGADLSTRVVVLTKSFAADETIACLRAGAADYVSLPATPRDILDALTRARSCPRPWLEPPPRFRPWSP